MKLTMLNVTVVLIQNRKLSNFISSIVSIKLYKKYYRYIPLKKNNKLSPFSSNSNGSQFASEWILKFYL